jgi:hypothetical protein
MEHGGITRALIEKLDEHFSTLQQRLDARIDQHFNPSTPY